MDLVIQQKGDIREHIYSRPDTYIGSVLPEKRFEWVVDNIDSPHEGKFIYKEIDVIDGLIQIFNEIRSNAIDNKWRSDEANIAVSEIKFHISKKKISIFNDGRTIPIETQINKRTGTDIYKPELVFAEFWTSTNYDDTDKRKTSGKNGYGAKLTNTFSKVFKIETFDAKKSLLYKQKWKKNLTKRYDPKITESKGSKGYTKITYVADFERFGIKKYSDDTLSYFYRLCFDTALTTQLKVYVNGKLLDVASLLDYTMRFRPEKTKEYISFSSKDSQVILLPKEGAHNNIMGFTNGIWNKLGGVHVDTWTKELHTHIIDIFCSKRKKKVEEDEKKTKKQLKEEKKKKEEKEEVKLSPADVKALFSIYIVCELENAVYQGQAKEQLKGPKPTIEISEKDLKNLKKIKKWSVANEVKELLEFKKKKELKKLDSKKTYKNVPKLQDANFAGTKKSSDCSLIVCEGDSAATYAKVGIEKGVWGKKGTNFFGILPLTGKILNVRKTNIKTILKDKVVPKIINSLGLKFDVDYSDEKNFASLRYGHLIILTDADDDGIHIKGLVVNFIETLFPSLSKRGDFIMDMRTPLYRIETKEKMLEFYTDSAFRDYMNSHIVNKKNIQYFKGLGATNDDQIMSSFGEKTVFFNYDDNAHSSLDLGFEESKTGAPKRKKWLEAFEWENARELIDEKKKEYKVDYTDFIHHELILFSLENNLRAIPNIMDGFKPSQRKLIFTGLKKKIFSLKKLESFASLASDITSYHHGAKNLEDTAIGMAQTFPASNNLTFFKVKGQVGSRLRGGKDASKARYVEVCLNEKMVKSFFRDEECCLTYLEDDGKDIEPMFYLPPVPIVLFNMTQGIGTGYSTMIPSYLPQDVIKSTRRWIECKKENKAFDMEDLVPYFNDFKGSIERKPKGNSFLTKGIYTKKEYKGKWLVNVTELPIGTWTLSYYEYLKELREAKKIDKLNDNTKGKNIINFEFVVENDFDFSILDLENSLSVNNFILFDSKRKLRKYKNTIDIISDFCECRFEFYEKRKKKALDDMKLKHAKLGEKYRFLNQVVQEEIKVFEEKQGKSKKDIIAQIEENKYLKFNDSFDYLLKIPMYKLTKEEIEKVNKDIEKTKQEIDEYINLKVEDIWLKEIDELVFNR